MNELSCHNRFLLESPSLKQNVKRVKLVLFINVVVMVLEIYFGYISGSMSLLADGWHMGTHAAALLITVVAYKLATDDKMTARFNFGGGKIIALGGFSSGLLLFGIATAVAIEAIQRIFHPQPIQYDEAFFVAVFGLLVNIAGAFILRPQKNESDKDSPSLHAHHSHGAHSHAAHHAHGGATSHNDHNIRAAYLHIVADALTSIGAIVAILSAKYWGLTFLDPAVAIVSTLVILKWAYGLLKDTSWELLDGHAEGVDFAALRKRILEEQVEIIDLHVWKVGPQMLSAELVVATNTRKGIAIYRQILENDFGISHSVIEEREKVPGSFSV